MAKKTQTKKTTETAVARKETAQLANTDKDVADLYDDEDEALTSSDIMISRILLMQGQSSLVEQEKATPGQIVGSLEADLLADNGQELEVIPFHRYKSFRLFKAQPGGGKPLFIKEMPYDKDTIEWENKRLREVEIDGEMLMCFITWNYYVMLPNELDALPRMMSFSSTNFKVGKMLTTHTVSAAKMFRTRYKTNKGSFLPFKTYIFGSEKTKNEKGNWFLYNVKKGRETTEAERAAVYEWAKMAKTGGVKVHEDDDLGDIAANDEPQVEQGKANDGDEF